MTQTISEEIIAMTEVEASPMTKQAKYVMDKFIAHKGAGGIALQTVVDKVAADQKIEASELMSAVKALAVDQGITLADYEPNKK